MSRDPVPYTVPCPHRTAEIHNCKHPACVETVKRIRELMPHAAEEFPAAAGFVTTDVQEARVRGMVEWLRANAEHIAGDLVALLTERAQLQQEVTTYREALTKISELEESDQPSPAGRMGDVARAALRGTR